LIKAAILLCENRNTPQEMLLLLLISKHGSSSPLLG
jgi:hypothetical protein